MKNQDIEIEVKLVLCEKHCAVTAAALDCSPPDCLSYGKPKPLLSALLN